MMDMNDLSSYAQAAYQQAQYGFPQNGFLTAEQVQQAMSLAGHVPTDANGQAILLDGSMNAQMAASDTADSEESFDGESPLFDEGDGIQAGTEGNVNGEGSSQARGKDGDESVGNSVDAGKKRRRGRVRFTDRQVELLEARFVQDQYLPAMERTHLATVVSLNESQVKTWFQNRRAKSKRAAKRKARATALASQTHGVMPLSTAQSSGSSSLRQCPTESSSSGAAQAASAQTPYPDYIYAANAYGAASNQVFANGAAQTMSTSYTGTASAVSPQQQYAAMLTGGVPANGSYAHAQYPGGVNAAYQTPVAAAQAAYGAASMGYDASSSIGSSNAYSMYADQGADYYARFMNASAPAMMT